MLTIQLPETLETSIRAAVDAGRFASIDDAMAEAARLLLQQVRQAPREAMTPATGREDPAPSHKPIWEEILELTAKVPDEEWDKLPKDGAEQLDHYIYGTPKRPTAQ